MWRVSRWVSGLDIIILKTVFFIQSFFLELEAFEEDRVVTLYHVPSQWIQKNCITFVQCWTSVQRSNMKSQQMSIWTRYRPNNTKGRIFYTKFFLGTGIFWRGQGGDTLPRAISVNTKHLYTICTMSDQRRRRWADVVQMLYKCFLFAGIYCLQTELPR